MWKITSEVAIDVPTDDEVNPSLDMQWSSQGIRTGIYGSIAPRIIVLPNGKYRMYYTQIMPRPGYSEGANDYGNASARILSATSLDGIIWTPEPGVRLSPQDGGAGEFRVVVGDVVPVEKANNKLRMYYECSKGTQEKTNSIRSVISNDSGLKWETEQGTRFSNNLSNYTSPRIVFLENGKCRLYCGERGKGIVSALSEDVGITFYQEDGVRISSDGPYDSKAAYAPEIIKLEEGGYIMYYAGYSNDNKAYILRAVSDDGLIWRKLNEPVISPTPGTWGAAKCSEMSVYRIYNQKEKVSQYRMVFEACDGTAKDRRGVWRIACAKSLSI